MTKYQWKLISGSVLLLALSATGLLATDADDSAQLAKSLGVSFSGGTGSTLILERNGTRYQVDLTAKTIQELGPASGDPAAALFQQDCAECHGASGKGLSNVHTPDFTNPALQRTL